MRIQSASLRLQIILVVAIAGILVTSFVAIAISEQQREVYYSQFASDLNNLSQRIAFDLELASNNLGRDIIALAAAPAADGIIRATEGGGVDRLITTGSFTTDVWKQTLADQFRSVAANNPAYDQLRFIGDADGGREIVRVERRGNRLFRVPEEELQQKGNAKYFQEVRETADGTLYYSAVNLNRENNVLEMPPHPSLRVGTPIYDGASEFYGAILINWDINTSFDEFLSALRTETGIEQIELFVTNMQGDFLHHPDPTHTFGFEFGESYRIQDEFTDIAALIGEVSTIENLGRDSTTNLFTAGHNGRNIYAQARMVSIDPSDESRDLLLFTTLDRSVLDAPVTSTMIRFWMWVILIFSAVLLSIIWLLSYELSPLIKITNIAKLIAGGDYSSKLPSPGSKEVGDLVNALGHMRSNISRRERELQDHRNSLEATVLERTRALEDARDEAKRQAKFKGEFLANMSHEIRTPMTAVLGLLDVLRHTDMDSRQQQYVQQIYSSSRALLLIIDDILDISKIEAGKVSIVSEEFSLLESLEEVVNLFSTSANFKSIELHLSMDTRIDSLLIGDKSRLGQVLNNLVGNAIKFTERGEVVLSSLVLEESESSVKVRFSVSDTGIGIDQDSMSRLFKAFEQADTKTTRMFGGTGLGLAISYKLITLLGGELRARSELGAGAEFWFDLQFEVSDRPEHRLKSIENFDKKVLLVDANPVSGEILTEMLGSWGCKVVLAKDYDQALNYLESAFAAREPYDVILMDNEISKTENFQLVNTIERLSSGTDLPTNPPILMLTKEELSRLQNDGSLPRSVTVAIKPVTVSQLLHTLEEMNLLEAYREDVTVENIEILSEQLRTGLDALPAPARILLAEDNLTNQLVVQEIFARYRIEFIIANNGKEAVEVVRDQKIDLVLMDLQMPVMDGFEATQKIRSSKSKHELPILSLSAATFAEDLDNASLAGMNAHLSKPIDIELMLAALLKWLP